MGSFISFILMLISLTGLIIARVWSISILKIIFKITSSLLFLSTAYFARRECDSKKSTTYYKLMFTGLVFSLFGDTFLVLQHNHNFIFILGVASFACAHIFYTIAFFQFGKMSRLNLVSTAIFIIILQWLIFGNNLLDLGSMKPLIVGYSILISCMVGKSLTLLTYRNQNPSFVMLTVSGAVLFLISDSILLFALFGKQDYAYLETLNNILYYIGQGLFGLSFRNELILKSKKN